MHCADRESALPVADDFFSASPEPVLLLEIDPTRLNAEVRREPPAPIPGGGTGHLETSPLFPHIYGPIESRAICRLARLPVRAGRYAWPEDWLAPESFLPSAP